MTDEVLYPTTASNAPAWYLDYHWENPNSVVYVPASHIDDLEKASHYLIHRIPESVEPEVLDVPGPVVEETVEEVKKPTRRTKKAEPAPADDLSDALEVADVLASKE